MNPNEDSFGKMYQGESYHTEAGRIIDLSATGDDETPTIGGQAIEPMVVAILERGNVQVDTVLGRGRIEKYVSAMNSYP